MTLDEQLCEESYGKYRSMDGLVDEVARADERFEIYKDSFNLHYLVFLRIRYKTLLAKRADGRSLLEALPSLCAMLEQLVLGDRLDVEDYSEEQPQTSKVDWSRNGF